jgi:integrase
MQDILRGVGSVSLRKDGKWTARMVVGKQANGAPKIKAFYGKTKLAVKKMMATFRAQNNAANIPKHSMSQYMARWLTVYKAADLKGKSFDVVEDVVDRYILPEIGYISISKLQPDDIQKMINNVSQRYSYSITHKVYCAINACLKFAMARRDISYNPMEPVRKPKKTDFAEKTVKVLTENEAEKYVSAATICFKSGLACYRLGWAFVLILHTGLRLGEALALRWKDIDWEGKVLTVSGSLSSIKNRNRKNETDPCYISIIKTAKTKSSQGRKIPLNASAMKALAELRQETGKYSYVCASHTGGNINGSNFYKTHIQICRRAGIHCSGVHALRHTFASRLFNAGVDVKTVSGLLGHADVGITYNTYIHVAQERGRDAVALLDNMSGLQDHEKA